MNEKEIQKTGKKVGVQLFYDDNLFLIRKNISFYDAGVWGVLLILLGGCIICGVTIGKNKEFSDQIVGLAFGGFLIIMALIALIREIVSYLKIENNEIEFRYNFKKRKVIIDGFTKVKQKFSEMEIGNSISLSVKIELFTKDNCFTILDYSSTFFNKNDLQPITRIILAEINNRLLEIQVHTKK